MANLPAPPPGTAPGPRPAACLGVFAIALVARVVARAASEIIPRDAIVFLDQAGAFLRGDWAGALAHYQHPLFAGLTAGAARVTGLDPETAGAWISAAGGALAAVALARLTGEIFGGRAGATAGLLYAALPLAVRTSAQPLTEGVFHALILGAAWSGHRAMQSGSRLAAGLAGLAGGLAYLTRPEGLAVPAVVGLGVLLLARGAPRPRRLTAAAALAIGLLVTAGPYAGYLSARAATLRISAKKDLAILAGARADRPVQPLSDEGLAGRPGRAAAELGRHLAESLSYGPLVLALLGVAAVRRRRRGELLLGLLVAVFAIVLFRVALTYGYVSRRHVLTVGLFLLGWSGVGLERLADWLAVLLPGRSGARKPDDAAAGRRRGAVHGVLLALAVGALLPFALAAPDRDHLPLKRLGLWIRERSGPGRRIAPLGYPRVCYYAGGTPVEVLSRHQAVVAESPPPGALEALGAALSRGDVEIVIQSSRQPAGLRRWLDTVSAPLHRVEDPEKQRWWCARSLDSR